MKYSQILKANSDLVESLPDKKFKILVLSNIITSQLNEILEYTLRVRGIPAIVKSGNYDNIVQDSLKYNDLNTVIIFWELCNFIDGLQFKIELLNEDQLDEIIEKTKSESPQLNCVGKLNSYLTSSTLMVFVLSSISPMFLII